MLYIYTVMTRQHGATVCCICSSAKAGFGEAEGVEAGRDMFTHYNRYDVRGTGTRPRWIMISLAVRVWK